MVEASDSGVARSPKKPKFAGGAVAKETPPKTKKISSCKYACLTKLPAPRHRELLSPAERSGADLEGVKV